MQNHNNMLRNMKRIMINRIQKILLYIFNIILGLIIIFYTIYRRILLVRLPKDLYFIGDNGINVGLALLVLVSIFISSFMFYKNISILLGKKTTESFFSNKLSKIMEVISRALQEMYGIIGSLFKDPYNKISFITQKFYKYFQNISETLFLFILYGIRFIILICFLIDVFIYFQLSLMYYSLYLLCLSLWIKILFYIMKDFSGNLEEAESMLNIINRGVNPITHVPRTSYSLKKEYQNLDLEYYVGQYILCSKITGYLDMYNRYDILFSPYINSIFYFSYLIGWLYIFLINIL
jgi:hypothetical protein